MSHAVTLLLQSTVEEGGHHIQHLLALEYHHPAIVVTQKGVAQEEPFRAQPYRGVRHHTVLQRPKQGVLPVVDHDVGGHHRPSGDAGSEAVS